MNLPENFGLLLAKEFQSGVLDQLGVAEDMAPSYVDGHDICRVQVDPCGYPVDAKVIHQKPNGPKETRTEFFVRVANGTKALDAVEREKYILSRWGSVKTAR